MTTNSINIKAYFPGDDDIFLEFQLTRSAVSGNTSKWTWKLEDENPQLHHGKYSTNQYPWKIILNGVTLASGTHNLDFRVSADEWTLSEGTTGWLQHDSNGDLTLNYTFYHDGSGSSLGKATKTGSFQANRIYYAPLKPDGINFGTITTTSIAITGVPDADTGHQPILDYQFQVALGTDTDWSPLVATRTSGSLGQTFSGLQPGVQYRFRFRSRNSIGYSPWSDAFLASTIGITAPPSLTVTPAVSGTSAVLTVGAVEGLPNPSGYRIERTNPNNSTTVFDTTFAPYTATGLTPGSTYGWRIAVKSGTFVSDYSTKVTATQPQPNTNPGDFFDGNSPDGLVTYGWLGTANKSISTATAPAAAGWATTHNGGGSSVVTRALGGLFGDYCALVTLKSDTTGPGLSAGGDSAAPYGTPIEPDALYYGSLYVLLPRDQLTRVMIRWYDSTRTYISTSFGDSVMVSGNVWTRLVTSGVSPSNAAFAAIRFQDLAGTGWSQWLAGDRFMMDGGMLSLGEQLDYFDGSFDDTIDYDYVWDGAEHASSSTRNVITGVAIDLLADPDVAPIPTAPRPPTVPDVSLDTPDMWRRYWVSIPKDYISQWLTVLPTFTLTTGGQPSHQARIRIFENPDNLDPTGIDVHVWVAEQIISFIPANTVLTLDSVSQRVYASIDGGASISADKLLYGTNGDPATWPALSCGQGYLVAVDVPIDSPEGNLSVDVALTRRW